MFRVEVFNTSIGFRSPFSPVAGHRTLEGTFWARAVWGQGKDNFFSPVKVFTLCGAWLQLLRKLCRNCHCKRALPIIVAAKAGSSGTTFESLLMKAEGSRPIARLSLKNNHSSKPCFLNPSPWLVVGIKIRIVRRLTASTIKHSKTWTLSTLNLTANPEPEIANHHTQTPLA